MSRLFFSSGDHIVAFRLGFPLKESWSIWNPMTPQIALALPLLRNSRRLTRSKERLPAM